MKNKEKVFRIIRYFFSIFIYLFALVCFTNKWLVSGIILVFSGTMLLPILDDLLKFKHKKIIEVLATIILFIFGIAITPTSQEEYNNVNSENTILITNEINNSTSEVLNETNNVESSDVNNILEEKNEKIFYEKSNNENLKPSSTSSSTSIKQPTTQTQSKSKPETKIQTQIQTQQPQTTSSQTEKKQTTTSSSTQNSTKTTSSQKVPSTSSSENNSHGKIIYGTPTGKKYHYDSDCAGKNAKVITSTNGLEPCKKCVLGH